MANKSSERGKQARSETTAVSGGWIKREVNTGRFMEVRTDKGVSRRSESSDAVVKDVSARRHAALKRLEDR